MVIRVSEIPDEGLRVECPGDLGAVYSEEEWRLDAASLLIERRGQDVAVTGRFDATARLACGRCLEPLVTQIGSDVNVHLMPVPSARQGRPSSGPTTWRWTSTRVTASTSEVSCGARRPWRSP